MKNLKQQAYEMIKDKIIKCEYAPDTMINEEILCRDTGMSRTPIRDAVSRLEQEGLVHIYPKKGIRISKFTFHDVAVLYEARTVLELYAIRNHGDRISREKLEEMIRLFQAEAAENTERTYETDDQFHFLLIESTGNDFFIDLYGRMLNQIHRLRVMNGYNSAANKQRIIQSAREHIAIASNILEGKLEEAVQEMAAHLSASQAAAYSVLAKDNYQSIPLKSADIRQEGKKEEVTEL